MGGLLGGFFSSSFQSGPGLSAPPPLNPRKRVGDPRLGICLRFFFFFLFSFLPRPPLLLGGYRLDLEDGAGELAALALDGGADAHGGEGAAEDAAGEPEELRVCILRVSPKVTLHTHVRS